jgi:hypothetical protein
MNTAEARNIDRNCRKVMEHRSEIRHGSHPSRETNDPGWRIAVLPREKVTSDTAEHQSILAQAARASVRGSHPAPNGLCFVCSGSQRPTLYKSSPVRLDRFGKIRGSGERRLMPALPPYRYLRYSVGVIEFFAVIRRTESDCLKMNQSLQSIGVAESVDATEIRTDAVGGPK